MATVLKSPKVPGQLLSPLHNPQTKRDNFCLHKEVNRFRIVSFDQSANDPKGSHPKVLKRFRPVARVQKRVQKQRDVRYFTDSTIQEVIPSLRVECQALEQT